MLNFETITLGQKSIIDSILQPLSLRATEFAFTSLFAWSKQFNTFIAFDSGSYFVRSGNAHDGYVYLRPPGIPIEKALEVILSDVQSLKLAHPKAVVGLILFDAHEAEQAAQIVHSPVPVHPLRDTYDYIYNANELATLAGKKYQPKRNHISFFEREYNCQIEPVTKDNLGECIAMNAAWCLENECEHQKSLQQETCAVHRILTHYHSLNMMGLLLRVQGKVIAYTVGEMLCPDTLIVHIEKAFASYRGAYPYINRAFVRYAAESNKELQFVNREDDAGNEGLRTAKLSYHPAYLLEKYFIHLQLNHLI